MKAAATAFFVAWLLVELTGAIDEIADDMNYDSDEYSTIAARLNCSKLEIRHEGVKTVAISTPSIYMPRPGPPPPPLKRIAKKQPLQHQYPPNTFFSNFARKLKSYQSKQHHKSGMSGMTEIPSLGGGDKDPSDWDTYPKPENDCYRDEEKEPPECASAFDDDGSAFNWYQVLLANGGAPGNVTESTQSPGRVEVLEPCHRPITDTSPPSGGLLYDFELMVFEKVYRREKASLRFAGTSSEFVDVDGELIWPPPHTQRRYYRLSYRKDDTGFYVKVHKRQKCAFEAYPLSVNCREIEDFTACEENMYSARQLGAALLATLVGGLAG